MLRDRFGMLALGTILMHKNGETCKVMGHSKKTVKGAQVLVYKVKYLTGSLAKKTRSIEKSIIDNDWIVEEVN